MIEFIFLLFSILSVIIIGWAIHTMDKQRDVRIYGFSMPIILIFFVGLAADSKLMIAVSGISLILTIVILASKEAKECTAEPTRRQYDQH